MNTKIDFRLIRTVVLFGVLIGFLYLVNSGIIRTENQIENGTLAYFDLAPQDPRSLIQGDYMRLFYAIEADAARDDVRGTGRGQIVARLDENRVAHYLRIYEGGDLASDEILLNYRTVGEFDINIGVDSFFFQEGLADVYADARYAEVRVTEDGAIFLIDLVDENFNSLADAPAETNTPATE